MSKNKRIIFSITGIIIVSLFLIVYTFGYVLVKIKGNENSILSSLISKKVSVAYKEISNTSNGETISPGYEFIKVFTATNDGNVEVNYHIYLDNVENEFVRLKDITYTLYRSELNGTLDTNNLSDSDIVASGTFPTTDAYIKFNEEIETPNNYYTYALKINYAKTTESQNEDDGHIFSFRVQLDMNYPFTENTLAYDILNNAVNVTDEEKSNGYAEYMTFPTTIPLQEINEETESVLSVTQDDYGTSYYYRGNVKNNYINFAGMCWRGVRIEGDGSTKLILEDKDTTCESETFIGNWAISDGFVYYLFSYGNNVIYEYNNIDGFSNAFKSFQEKLSSTIKNKLKVDEWCYDDTVTEKELNREFYGALTRIFRNNKPQLKCTGTKLTNFNEETDMYVATLTADEISFAGINASYNYLMNDYARNKSESSWWSLTPCYNDFSNSFISAIHLNNKYGSLECDADISNLYYARPAITLKSDVKISDGNGTIDNPYTIK